ncbi:GlxA family transcriptional regulator [Coralliovum pocilloporae]|uniref:GlxA family transcriptional regulator n=1 Tax=Coralliovum pocilloporae TaxID=3066369 RepID=UPI0033070275
MTDIGLITGQTCRQSVLHGLSDLLETANTFSTTAPLNVQICEPDARFDDLDALIILPCQKPDGLSDGLRHLQTAHKNGSLIGSVCMGAFRLAETGLLDGRPATTHWSAAASFSQQFPTVQLDCSRTVIEEPDLITAGGFLAWIDLGLALIRRYCSQAVMMETAHFVLADPGRRDQRVYARFQDVTSHGDDHILRAQDIMRQNPAHHHTIAALADAARLEPRTFLRRFKRATGLTPTRYLQKHRLDQGCRLLETTVQSVEQIAWAVGYQDTGAFRALFQREIGDTPSEYRQRYTISDS